MRERGLKLNHLAALATQRGSLPMRERGLKRGCSWRSHPRAGVAPHAGAWIETQRLRSVFGAARSLPMRERGLKLQIEN